MFFEYLSTFSAIALIQVSQNIKIISNPVNPLIGGYPDMACATLRYQTVKY
ncbi:MAG: hypothetical protein HEQ24_08940 [Dolichospermum sp. BR01]|nr:hypothetical protein [Dolichospermum sp. BR01]